MLITATKGFGFFLRSSATTSFIRSDSIGAPPGLSMLSTTAFTFSASKARRSAGRTRSADAGAPASIGPSRCTTPTTGPDEKLQPENRFGMNSSAGAVTMTTYKDVRMMLALRSLLRSASSAWTRPGTASCSLAGWLRSTRVAPQLRRLKNDMTISGLAQPQAGCVLWSPSVTTLVLGSWIDAMLHHPTASLTLSQPHATLRQRHPRFLPLSSAKPSPVHPACRQ